MALAVTLTFTITDALGKSAITKVRVPTGFSIAQYLEFGTAMGNIIAALANGAITDITIGVPLSLSGATIRAVATSLADVGEKALLMAQSAITGLFARFNIPTYDQSKTVSGSDQVDTTDTDVAAYIAVIESGVSGVAPCDRRANDLVDVISVRQVFGS